MAVKTITIDLEAYGLLARRKQEGQSFSQVIKEHFGGPPTTREFLARLRRTRISEDGLDSMERLVEERRDHPARAVKR
jgi:predicted CopG family antitoxin